MENIVYDGLVYERLFRQGDYILKYSRQSVNAWEALTNKYLPFLNIPSSYSILSEEEKDAYKAFSKIYIPYLYGYKTLYGNSLNIEEKEILLFLKKLLEYVQTMHKNNFYHGDIFSQNIMVNDNLDVSFIDLDASIVEDFISDENVYFEDEIEMDEKKLLTLTDDKLGIFNLFLHYFTNGNFNVGVDYDIDYKKLRLSNSLTREIEYLSTGHVLRDYYFQDIIDELIDKGYTLKK